MLKLLRQQKTKKRIYLVLALIVIPSFVITGAVLFVPGEKGIPTVLGRVDKESITLQEYLDSYRAVQRQMMMVYGDQFAQMRRFMDLKAQAWDRLLLLHDARQKKIRTSDKEVVAWVESQEAFQRNGAFDLNSYKGIVSGLGTSTKDFENEIRQMLTLRKLVERLSAEARVSDEELKDLYARRHSGRDLRLALIERGPADAAAPVTEKQLADLYEMTQGRLTDPERIRLRYLRVSSAEAETKKAVLDARDVPLEELAAQHGLETKETPLFSKNDAVPDLGNAPEVLFQAFALESDRDSEWIRTGSGDAFKVKVIERRAERPLTLEESKDTLRKLILENEAQMAARERAKALLAKIQGPGGDFEKTLAAEKIEVRSVEGRKTGEPLGSAAPLSPEAEEAIASLKTGETGGPFDTAGGAALLVQAVKDRPVDETAFAKDREDFRRGVLNERADGEVDKVLKELRGRLKVDLEAMRKIFAEDETPAAA